jgi:hypothetical protein
LSTTHSRTPFFSVVIPTKNRAFVVPSAIQSVLNQTFSDFEIVVVDNDDSQATQEVVEAFADPRLRYVRTGGLTMADNWERAYAEARGTYRLLLEDKSVLKPRALSKIWSALQQNPAPVVSWPQDMFNDTFEPPYVGRGMASRATRLFTSDELLKLFMTERRGIAELRLPRGMNSAIHQDLYKTIMAAPLGRLCPPVSPDYTMAYLQLNYADTVLNIEDCLTVYGSCKLSHGWATTKQVISNSYLKRDFGLDSYDQYWKAVPAPIFVTAAYTFNDYVSIRSQVSGRLERFPLDPHQFFLEAARDIRMVRSTGVNMDKVQAEWDAGFAKQPAALRSSVSAILAREYPTLSPARQAFDKSSAAKMFRLVKRLFGWRPPSDNAVALPPPHATPSEYIEWENQATLGSV